MAGSFLSVAIENWLEPQFCIQLLYKDNLPFTHRFENPSFSLFWPQKSTVKAKIWNFLTFLQCLTVLLFAHENMKKLPSNTGYFRKIEVIFPCCPDCPNGQNNVTYRPTVYKTGIWTLNTYSSSVFPISSAFRASSDKETEDNNCP